MKKQDYDKLNEYLNDIFLTLEERDSFLLRNILNIAKINGTFLSFINKYDLSEDLRENKITYQDVFLLAREIIASIDKSYLNDYNKLIDSGQLDFGYDKKNNNCYYFYKNNLIDIDREFNYEDVVSLVHEFIHYTNGKGKLTQNRYLLTEFLSIYFELYALDYLLESGISKDEISVYGRLDHTLDSAESIYSYELVFLAYEKFGAINQDTSDYMNQYYLKISKENFENECEEFLNMAVNKENEYKRQLSPQAEYKRQEFIEDLCNPFFDNYRYFLGALIAYYARKNCKVEDVVYLNNHINDSNFGDENISILLKKVGIDIKDEKFIVKTLESVYEFILKYSNKKNR